MTHPPPSHRPAPVAALCLFLAGCAGCKPTPPVKKETPLTAVAGMDSAAPPAPSASASPITTIPTLVAEKFAPGGAKLDGLYAVEGGLAVTEGTRVGLVAGDGITWVGSIPKETPSIGENQITSVVGRAPDLVAAVYVTTNGRAPRPTYQLLTGKKASIVAAGGGSWGYINGAARVGETVFVATDDMYDGPRITPVHGPKLVRHLLTPAEAGCKAGEATRDGDAPIPAVIPDMLGSTPAGTMISLGPFCLRHGPAAEVWDKDGKTRIIDVSRWWKTESHRGWLLKGEGDELWAARADWTAVVLHYKDGALSAVPELTRRIDTAFVSPRGQLHVSSGKVVYRLEGDTWAPAFILPADLAGKTLAMDAQGALWSSGGGVFRLRPGPAAPPPVECATHFVDLYAASAKNGSKYTYPTTRKALADFPEASSLGLVEFGPNYARRLGVTVKSRAQGQALIAHLATAMKDEDPHYFCYEPTTDVRQIPLDAVDKP